MFRVKPISDNSWLTVLPDQTAQRLEAARAYGAQTHQRRYPRLPLYIRPLRDEVESGCHKGEGCVDHATMQNNDGSIWGSSDKLLPPLKMGRSHYDGKELARQISYSRVKKGDKEKRPALLPRASANNVCRSIWPG